VVLWENGLGGSGGYERIFSEVRVLEIREKIKKIRIHPPDPPNPFSHSIGIFLTLLAKYQIYSSPKVIKKDRFGEE
jgi:hypothetical protein